MVLATVLGHDGTTGTLPLTTGALEAAIRGLAPAEACTSMPHPNLAAWREVLAEATSNPARTLVAVFVADLTANAFVGRRDVAAKVECLVIGHRARLKRQGAIHMRDDPPVFRLGVQGCHPPGAAQVPDPGLPDGSPKGF